MTHSPETARRILDDIAAGCSVAKACEKNGVTDACVYAWANGRCAPYDGFAEDYAHAMAIRSDRMADEIIAIADDSGFDAKIIDGRAVVDGDAIQRARLRVDSRKWIMAKMQPKKYGESYTVKGDKENPLFNADDVDAVRKRIEELERIAASGIPDVDGGGSEGESEGEA